MGRCFLPVDDSWPQFIDNCDEAYKDLEMEQTKILRRLSNVACRQFDGSKYSRDPWLWDLDWKTQTTKILKQKPSSPSKRSKTSFNSIADIRAECEKRGFTEEQTEALLALLSTDHIEDLCPLEFHKMPMLKMLCRVKGLALDGRKADLVARLRQSPHSG